MEQTEENFTLETLAKFYTKAAKAGGMEVDSAFGWTETNCGPNLNSTVKRWRPKQVPVVRYAIKFPDGYVSNTSFQSVEAAQRWSQTSTAPRGEVIKLVEEI